MQPFDLVIRGGTIATATDTMQADLGIRGSTIAAIGQGLDKGHKEIDARGKLVLPGGVIGLLDYGMVGMIDESLREDLSELFLALGSQDAAHLASIVVRLGSTPPELDRAALAHDLAEFIAQEKPPTIKTWVDDATYRKVREAASTIEARQLSPIFQRLDGRVPYDTIRLVIAHLEAIESAD